MKEYTCIESFCGPGGMSLGLERACFQVRFAFDSDKRAVETHQKNQSPPCEVLDAREATGKYLRGRAGLSEKDGLDLFSGGPPCQGFSKQRRGAHLGDSRNELILEFARLVIELNPRFFLLENVEVFGQKRGKQYLKELERMLSNYVLTPRFFNSADFGLAQTRKRFILVGRRSDVGTEYRAPLATHKAWATVAEALKGIPEPPESYGVHPDFPNHQRTRVTDINIKRFSHVPQGGGWRDIPRDMQLACHQKVDPSKGGWPDVYGRLEADGQCPTITGGFDSFTRGRYGHPYSDRPLTPREAARLQGFPDNYEFLGTRGDWRSQIGNAVPPPLAAAMGLAIREALTLADGLQP